LDSESRTRRGWLRHGPHIIFFVGLAILPLCLSSYGTSLLTEILIYGIFALSLNLLLGYTGLPSFGHAAFFGIGAYTVGFLTKNLLFGKGLAGFIIVAGGGLAVSVVLGMVFGVLVVGSEGATFLMLTLALAQVLWAVAFSWRSLTGGDDGMANIGQLDLKLPFDLDRTATFCYLALIFFILSYIVLRRVVRSPFGHALIGIRENELRMKALGYNTWRYKYTAYVVAGLFGGLAGVLHAYFYRYVGPYDLGIDLSGSAMFMVIIGSRSIFVGPVVGAAIVSLMKHLVGSLTEYWPFFLGMVFVGTVMYARKGICAYAMDDIRKWITDRWKS
jgi:branched-chain amino acid transport system permease protein